MIIVSQNFSEDHPIKVKISYYFTAAATIALAKASVKGLKI